MRELVAWILLLREVEDFSRDRLQPTEELLPIDSGL